MGYYQDNVLPHILNKAMNTKVERAARERVCEGLHGQVVEIGFGSGLNTGYYPSEVTKVLAVEPSKVSMRLAEPRIAASSADVELAGLDGQHLDLESAQFDAVLSTWTLCTIPDLVTALGPRFGESSSLVARSTLSSTATPPTPTSRVGRSGSSR